MQHGLVPCWPGGLFMPAIMTFLWVCIQVSPKENIAMPLPSWVFCDAVL